MDTFVGRTDEELLLSYGQTGDDEALGALVTRHWPRTWRVASRSLGDGALAEDVAQEAFVKLARHAGRFSRGRSFAPWFQSITSNAVRNAARGRSRRRLREEAWRAPAPDAAPEPDEAEEKARLTRALQDEVRQLSPKLRDAVVLRHLEGLSLEETAARLDCPVGTVSSRLRRGLEQLEQGLARQGVASVALPELLQALADRAPRAPVAPTAAAIAALAIAKAGAGASTLAVIAALLLTLVGGGLAVAVGAPSDPDPPVAAAPSSPSSSTGEVAPTRSAGAPRAPTPVDLDRAPPRELAPGPLETASGRDGSVSPETSTAGGPARPARPLTPRPPGHATPEAAYAAAQAAYEEGDLRGYVRLLTLDQQRQAADRLLLLADSEARRSPDAAARLRVVLERAGIGSVDEIFRPGPDSSGAPFLVGVGQIPDPLAFLDAIFEADPRSLRAVGFPTYLDHELRHLTVLRDQASAMAGDSQLSFQQEEGGWRLGRATGSASVHLVPRKPEAPPPPPPRPPLASVELVEHRGAGWSVRMPAEVQRRTDTGGEILAGAGAFLRIFPPGDLPATAEALRADVLRQLKGALDAPLVDRPLADGAEVVQVRADRAYVWVLRRGKGGSFVARASGEPRDLEALRAIAESLQVP